MSNRSQNRNDPSANGNKSKKTEASSVLDKDQIEQLVGDTGPTTPDMTFPTVERRDSQPAKAARPPMSFDERVDRCLSMILHHEEVQMIAEVAKLIYHEQNEAEDEV